MHSQPVLLFFTLFFSKNQIKSIILTSRLLRALPCALGFVVPIHGLQDEFDDMLTAWVRPRTTFQRCYGGIAYMRWRWQAKLANNPHSTNILAAVTSSLAYMFVMLLRYPMLTMTLDDHQSHSFGNRSNTSHGCFSSAERRHRPALFHHLSPKTMLVLAFTAGYALGKVPAFFAVSKLPPWKRLRVLLGIVLFSFVTIVCFFKCASILFQSTLVFVGAIPLSSMFGVMTQYLEGRRATDKLNIGLSLVMLLGGGLARSIAAGMHKAMNDEWDNVPVMVAAVYLPICLVSLVVLDTTPPPTKTDAQLQQERRPLSMRSGASFFAKFWPGLSLVFLGYAAASAVRNFREYFAADIYEQALHRGHHRIHNTTFNDNVEPWEFLVLELPAAVVTGVAIYSISFVQSNRKALFMISAFITIGGTICMVSTLCYTDGLFGKMPSNRTNGTNHSGGSNDGDRIIPSPTAGYIWIFAISTGTYLMYLPGGFLMFDRLIAASRVDVSAAFLIYGSDIFGQFATFGITVLKEFGAVAKVETHHDFFIAIINPVSVTMIASSLLSIWYFSYQLHEEKHASKMDPASYYDEPLTSPSSEAVSLLQEQARGGDQALFHECPICSSRFSAAGALRIHVLQMHQCAAWDGVATQVRMQIRDLEKDKTRILSHSRVSTSSFSYKTYEPIAKVSLHESPPLAALFAECVPSKISASSFWAGYDDAVRVLKTSHNSKSIYRNRTNFDSDAAYEVYMQSLVSPGMRVIVRESHAGLNEGDIGTYCGVGRSGSGSSFVGAPIAEVEFEGAEVKLVMLNKLELLEGASGSFDDYY